MKAYSNEDFAAYFRGAIIRSPQQKGSLVTVHQCANGAVVVHPLSKVAPAYTVPLDSIEWEHVAIPRLGYINTNLVAGTGLYYLERRVRRIASKGYGNDTVTVRPVPEYEDAASRLSGKAAVLHEERITPTSVKIATNAFYPEYLSHKEAANRLLNKATAVGIALSPNYAMVLGTTKKAPLLLLWKRLRVASSEDGVKWNFYCDEYKSAAKRELGIT